MLAERADGMYVIIFVMLVSIVKQVSLGVLPVGSPTGLSSVERFLGELPESLDETYECVLREIKLNRFHTRRLLVAAIRPLRVEELAEVLAMTSMMRRRSSSPSGRVVLARSDQWSIHPNVTSLGTRR